MYACIIGIKRPGVGQLRLLSEGLVKEIRSCAFVNAAHFKFVMVGVSMFWFFLHV